MGLGLGQQRGVLCPIRPGDPGFQSKFDRDNDGIGCE